MRPARAAGASVALLLAVAAGGGLARAQVARVPGADDLRFTRFSVEEGLSQSIVRDVFQDRRGFLWVGTNNGLNQYDGYRVTIYRHEPDDPNSLPGNVVAALAETIGADGPTLWAGTSQGLSAFDVARQRFVNYRHDPGDPRSLGSNLVHALHVDRRGVLWVATAAGLERFDPATRTFARHQHRPGDARTIGRGAVTSIAEAADGTLWVGTEHGLSRLSPDRAHVATVVHDPRNPASLAENRVRALLVDRQGRVWVGTGTKGVDLLDARTGAFRHFSPAAGFSAPSVNALLEDSEGQIWIGVWGGGVTRVVEDGGRISFVAYRHAASDPSTLGGDDVNVLAQDRSGVVWVGTYGAGLSWFRPAGRIRLTHYRHNPSDLRSLSDDRVHAILVDRAGTLWVGTWAGLNVLRPGSSAFARLTGALSDERVTSIAEGADGDIWVGTLDGGVNRIDARTRAVRQVRERPGAAGGLSSDRVTALHADATGAIWIGTLTAGLNRLDPETNAITQFRSLRDDAATLSGDRVQHITSDHRGAIWIATADGLDALDPASGRVRRVGGSPGAPPSLRAAVNAIHEFPAGLMWAATATGGVVRFAAGAGGDPSAFRTFDREDGLASEMVNRVLHDETGRLWMATAGGLNRFDPKTSEMLVFDEADGLRSEEFYAGAFHDAAGGRMLLGGPKGMTAFEPAEVRANPYAPPVALTGFTILNKPVPIGGASPLQTHISEAREIRLSHRDTVFSFEFAGFNYAAAGRVRYAYRLVGFDPDWNYTDASRRSATYTNLNPGEYTFEVRASNRDGVWSAEPVSLPVLITPPFWLTWWFKTLLGIAAVGLIVGTHRLRVSGLDRQRRRLERVVAERTAELQAQTGKATEARAAAERANADKSMFLANVTHEIRTPLNAVVGLSEALSVTRLNPQQQEYARALRSAGEALSEIIADILDVSKIEAERFELARAAFDLRRLIDEALDVARVAAATKGLALESDVASDVPVMVVGDHRALRRVLLNLLGNAVKFTEAGAVALNIACDAGASIVFIVTDTGIGVPASEQQRIFESFVQADSTISSKYGGTGLGLAISRRLVALMGGRIWLESVPGRGSTFSFSVPLPAVTPAQADQAGDVVANFGPPQRILVVDDAEQNRMVMRAYFQGTPHDVTMAESGEQALELFEASEFDLVLMDVHMPGMDGHAATRAIREWERRNGRPRTRIVAVTANAFPDSAERSREAGCDAHLTKPIRKPVLFEIVGRRFSTEEAPAHPGVSAEAGLESRGNGGRSGPIPITVPPEVAPHIPGYLEVTREQLTAAVASLEAGDPLLLRTLGHNLKGSGSSFGLEEVSRLGWRLEQAGARGEAGRAREAARDLADYLERLVISGAPRG